MKLAPVLGLLLLAGPATAQTGPVTRVISTAETTWSGQPIRLPQGPVQITASDTVLPVGGGLPAHKHPYPRYAYVLSGEIRLRNLETGQSIEARAGEVVLDPVDQWHEVAVLGPQPVRLLTFDQAPPGAAVVVRREP